MVTGVIANKDESGAGMGALMLWAQGVSATVGAERMVPSRLPGRSLWSDTGFDCCGVS